MAKKYRKEFFDREYSLREAYARVFRHVRPYWFRICVGLLCGLLSAGALIPFYQILQPTVAAVGGEAPPASQAQPSHVSSSAQRRNKLEKQMERAARLPSWYPKVEATAAKFGLRFADERGELQGAAMLIVLVVIPLVTVVRLLLAFLNGYCLTWAAQHAVADMRQEMLEHVQKQSLQFFGRIDMGQIMGRVNGDPAQLSTIITTILSEMAIAPFAIFISLGYVVKFAFDNQLTSTLVLLGVGLPLFLAPILALGRKMRKWSKRTLERSSVIGSRCHEILTGIRTVKAYHSEDFEDRSFRAVLTAQLKAMMRSLRVGLMVAPTVETVGLILVGAFVLWCFVSKIPLSSILPILAPLLIAYKPIKEFSKLQVQLENSLAALSRIFSLLDLHMELPERTDAIRKPSFSDRIAFEHVTFQYDAADRPALSDASFEIRKGSFVAIVGGTGSGKSTTGGLLSRFYDPQHGRISIDGIDLRDVALGDLRRLIGSVMQETVLFNDTIEENIRYGTPGATHADVVAAARLANAHDFIVSHPQGYDRLCGEKGFVLSGGERQRIAIARALLKNPPILILDEATSALDTATERLVQEALVNLMKNRTTLAIAHRLSTIRTADLILVMEHGKIVERGTHDELYAANGRYRRLCDIQKDQAQP